MKKQVVSIVLILALVASILPLAIHSVSAADEADIPYAVDGGYIYFNKASGTVTACDSEVTYAEIPAEIEGTAVTRIGERVFSGCDELCAVSIPASVTEISSDAFHACGELEEIWVAEENEVYASEDGVLLNKDKTVLLRYPEGRGCPCGFALYYRIPGSVTEIADYAFLNNPLVYEITFPEGLTSIGDYAFLGCRGLRAMLFEGDAPQTGEHFLCVYNEESKEYEEISDLKIYYVEGKEGWTSPTWMGYPTDIWETDHKHEFSEIRKEPTCTEEGYLKYVCSCGYAYVDYDLPALGHDYREGVCTRCGELDPDFKADFADIPENAWYQSAVDYAVARKLMNGTGNGNFEPESPMTRAMLVTVLWRYAGAPEEGENIFSDVESDQWYAKAVAWAAENGIVGGVGDGRFDPDGKITREQMAAILYRYSSAVGIDTQKKAELSSFPDGDKVSSYAADALAWAVAEGLITGSKTGDNTYLEPQGNATRAQVATILMRFIENVAE